jgi:membrane fusion protein (multidrug efflux system)
MATQEPSSASVSKPAAGRVRARLAGILASRKTLLRTALVSGGLIVIFVIIPRIFHALHTISTDDAYVNNYITFVAPRVPGQVLRVLVDDNNRVKKGDVLVELDPEPFRVQVAIKQAAVDTAQANVVVAQATVRSQLGQARGLLTGSL